MTDRLHETLPCPCCGRPCGLDEDLSWPDRDKAIRALVQIAVGTTRTTDDCRWLAMEALGKLGIDPYREGGE